MKLYGMVESAPCRAVLVCANELGLQLEIINVDLLNSEHLKLDFLQKNPQHTIPLLDDDGFFLSDSHAIMGYLVGKCGGNKDSLYPKNDVKQRAIIDHRLHFDTGYTFAAGLNLSKSLLFENIQPTQEKLDKLIECFKILDAILEHNKTKFFAGDNLTIADFSTFTTVKACSVFFPYAQLPNLKTYIERIEQLPCSKANEKGLKQYQELISSKLIK